MVKAVFCLTKKEGMSQDEFREYWLEEHAPLGRDLPNLRGYTVSFPVDPEGSEYDGIAELRFDSEDEMDEAMASDVGTEVVSDVPNFADPNEMLQMVVEEHVQVE